ncbi:MAG TPA: proton-conducting transporter membrane subunit [Desulfotignum sp.]|nr:proton-conducting transporter membrane subunit [Desulfotignum sp.]
MSHFFAAICLILAGGAISLVFARHNLFSRAAAAILISAGCVWGLVDAVIKLTGSVIHSAAFQYLNLFFLAFEMDGLSAFFLAVIFLICLLAAVYSFHYMDDPDSSVKNAVNGFFFSLLVISMALVVTAANMITFMLSWEIMSLSSFFLVIHNYQQKENQKAGYLYFVFSHVGAMFLFAGFGVLYTYTGSFGFTDVHTLPAAAKTLAFVLFFIGFGSKAGVFPFHVWLPHAHPAAPSHISAVMSGVMIKTGIYGILRMYALLEMPAPGFGYLVLAAGVVSGILGVVYALGQTDIKRLLAYSSVENIGIILIGMGIGMIGVSSHNPLMAVLGFSGAIFHVLNHAMFKSLLFMGAGMVVHQTGTRSMDALGGLLKSMKITGFAFIIGSLAICGLPPFNGFAGEFFIYMGGFKGISLDKIPFAVSIAAIVSLAVIGGLALACFTRVVGIVFQGEPRTEAARSRTETGPTMLGAMGVLAGICIVVGVFPGWFFNLVLSAVSALNLGYERIPQAPFAQIAGHITLGALVIVVLVLVVAVLRLLFYRSKPVSRSGTWGCGFTRPTVKMQYTGSSYAFDIIQFFRPAAPLEENHVPIAGRFPAGTSYDSRVHDIAERYMEPAVVRPVQFVFDRLRWIQHGDIHLYIGYILLAIVLLLFFI